ncbi:thiamine-repressible mitochondrial transport protein THI74-like [Phalaenopsis equestris]|uniref:thiamine-repressible mitochondrial transport protein THI74-like n=1 Tax=Phalaenopsis equestris TaxID=78828 RepID=UPI0009E5F323|nr:thiamine-repressible mitochondrial transport protein THI74-like [Phalaenopsis equestris]XP_020599450.1 thiamine-repressible mitochondrial transport protein THI74-like [Phalaenopsis equestris]
MVLKEISKDSRRWALGIVYIVAVASIWIAASYIVQTVVDEGVSPFLLTYICNSLFVVYIPIVGIARYIEGSVCNLLARKHNEPSMQASCYSENANLLLEPIIIGSHHSEAIVSGTDARIQDIERILTDQACEFSSGNPISSACKQLDSQRRWTHAQVAKVSLLICPFWFFAQLTFNLSLKYTTVTSNTILSSTSSLFTYLVSVAFLGEIFTWLKFFSVLLCMGGTVIVSLADLRVGVNAIAYNAFLGDALALVSAGLYAVYITLIRKKLPDEEKGEGHASMAQFLGYLGLFNLFIFLPLALFLNFTKIEPFHKLTWRHLGLIVGKGLLDNVLSDYLWAKAILLTTTTVATAGLTIQVPIAAIVDSITGHAPHLLDLVGAAAVILGFAGINIPCQEMTPFTSNERETEDIFVSDHIEGTTVRTGSAAFS